MAISGYFHHEDWLFFKTISFCRKREHSPSLSWAYLNGSSLVQDTKHLEKAYYLSFTVGMGEIQMLHGHTLLVSSSSPRVLSGQEDMSWKQCHQQSSVPANSVPGWLMTAPVLPISKWCLGCLDLISHAASCFGLQEKKQREIAYPMYIT